MTNTPANPGKKGRAKAPENETKGEKFTRLAVARTNNVLDAISKLEGLAAPALYDYTPEQWNKIFEAVNGQLAKVQARLTNPSAKVQTGFSL